MARSREATEFVRSAVRACNLHAAPVRLLAVTTLASVGLA